MDKGLEAKKAYNFSAFLAFLTFLADTG